MTPALQSSLQQTLKMTFFNKTWVKEEQWSLSDDRLYTLIVNDVEAYDA